MKNLLVAFITVLSISFTNAQTEVDGVTLDNAITIDGNSLVLNGAGTRVKYFMDMYVGGLYVTSKTNDGTKTANADEAMALKLTIVSGLISSDKMTSAVDDGFDEVLNGNTSAMQSKINKFKGFFSEEINKGDVFDISYAKGKGTTVYKNGSKVGSIDGLEFKKALFAIWLGNSPADKKLKKGMLGNS